MVQRRETEKKATEPRAAQNAQPESNHELTGLAQVTLPSTAQPAWIQVYLGYCYSLDPEWPHVESLVSTGGITERFWDHEGADLLCMKFKLNGVSGEGVSLRE